MKEPRLVHHLLERSAARRPAHPFLIHEGHQAPFEEIERRANQVAWMLIREGIVPGDRVALLARNSPFYVVAYYGILKAGGIVVPLNTTAPAEALSAPLGDCEPRVLIVGPSCERAGISAAARAASLELLVLGIDPQSLDVPSALRCIQLESACEAEPVRAPGLALAETDAANIVYTSGSTGRPQGVTLSHRNIVSNALSIASYLELGADERVLQVLPFYYVYGQSVLTTHTLVGASIVIENRAMYPAVVLDTLVSEACTGLPVVPSTVAILLDRTDIVERELSRLRYVSVAGAAMSPALTRRLTEALPGPDVYIMYGATEAAPRLAYLPPADLERKLGSIGKAIPGVELRLLREDGSEAAPNEPGEIVARGPNIMLGYWGDAGATSKAIDERGYHTGDIAYRDEEGFFFIVGRKRDFIKVGGNRVSAAEVEAAMAESPGVREVAVIGVPDDILGERICAFVVSDGSGGLSAARLQRELRARLPAYSVPSEVELVASLPRSEAGKVLKRELPGWRPRGPGAPGRPA
jgi:acyl-CoA synthetase (AMP-forming)/AMP-acid ligase II